MLRIIGAGLLMVIAAIAVLTVTPQEKTSLRAAVNAGPSHVLDWAQETASRRLGMDSEDEPGGSPGGSIGTSASTASDRNSEVAPSSGTTEAPTSANTSNIPGTPATSGVPGAPADLQNGTGSPGPRVVSSIDGGGDGGPQLGAGAPSPLEAQGGPAPTPTAAPAVVLNHIASGTPAPAAPSATPSAAATPLPTALAPTPSATQPPMATVTSMPPASMAAVPDNAGLASALLAAINEARAAEGLPALNAHTTLGTIAAGHASDIAAQRRLSHNGSDGSSLSGRLNRGGAAFGAAGENVGRGRGGAAGMPEIVRAFLASPVHRANILNPVFQKVGLGVVGESDGTSWVTVVFTD